MKVISSDEALQRLLEGNHRFVEDRVSRAPLGARLQEVAPAQHPFAAVLGCSDSRVPAELVFDCSLGDLFVVRTAGHVLSPSVVGSLEFAVVELQVPLIVVLGHTRCGAIQAALAPHDQPARGSMAALVQAIRPAIERVRGLTGNAISHAVTAHVEDTVEALLGAELLAPEAAAGRLKVAGARYDLDSGQVQLVGRNRGGA